ncbi:hypothetical protein [Vibrio barjaei]|uniref:hypothetical protein n=1 Tax=Vibrio barjaei TaxID=1676683 RepID=UPI00228354AF|nr:hypothetical protein [Vibrio barjaei]MCY9870357.1 hypothetical protein [Vibrio barjaei]
MNLKKWISLSALLVPLQSIAVEIDKTYVVGTVGYSAAKGSCSADSNYCDENSFGGRLGVGVQIQSFDIYANYLNLGETFNEDNVNSLEGIGVGLGYHFDLPETYGQLTGHIEVPYLLSKTRYYSKSKSNEDSSFFTYGLGVSYSKALADSVDGLVKLTYYPSILSDSELVFLEAGVSFDLNKIFSGPVVVEKTYTIEKQIIQRPYTSEPGLTRVGESYFDFDQAVVLNPDSFNFNRIKLEMFDSGTNTLVMKAYTDPKGGVEYNKSLAGDRCDAVADLFSVQGFKKVNIECIAVGQEDLLYDIEAFDRYNRRVDVYIAD